MEIRPFKLNSRQKVKEINQLRSRIVSEPSAVALYLVYLAQKKFGKYWCQGPRSSKNTAPPPFILPSNYNLEDFIDLGFFTAPVPLNADIILCQYRLKEMREKAFYAWSHWNQNPNQLVVLNYIPGVREVLKLQSQGQRCLTMIVEEELLDSNIYGGKDAYQFLLHDLDHAACFFLKNEWKEGQIGLYRFMLQAIECPLFKEAIKKDLQFKEKLEYALSDMNAHCLHLLKYIKAILIQHALLQFKQSPSDRMNNLAKDYLTSMLFEISHFEQELYQALLSLNNPEEEKYFKYLEYFFNHYQKEIL